MIMLQTYLYNIFTKSVLQQPVVRVSTSLQYTVK